MKRSGRQRPSSPRRRGEVESRQRPGEGHAPEEDPPGRPPRPAGSLPLAARALPAGGEKGGVPPDLVVLGEFGRAQGLRGEVRLKSHTGDPLAIGRYGPLLGRDGREVVLLSLRPASGGAPDMLVARVAGVTTREGAEALNRMALSVPRGRLPPPDDADEFLLADLVGMAARDEAGASLGSVAGVPNYGGGDLLEIRPEGGGPTRLVPFTKAFVPIVDIGGRFVVLAMIDEVETGEPEPDGPAAA